MTSVRLWGFVKNIIIVLLAAGCLHQTMQLWFDGAPSLNFLSMFGVSGGGSYDFGEMIAGISRPRRMLVSGGGGKYYAKSTDVEGAEEYAAAKNLAASILEGGEYGEVSAGYGLDWREVLSGPILIWEYDYLVPAEAFEKSLLYGEPGNGAIADNIKTFDMIIFIPGGGVTVVFFNSRTAQTLKLNAEDGEYADALAKILDTESPSRDKDLAYIASDLLGLGFGKLLFIPDSPEEGLIYRRIRAASPFDNEVLNTSSAAKLVSGFFDDPGAVRSDSSGGVYVFSDENTLVRYLDGNYLEYSSWKSGQGKNLTAFEDAYAEAVAFIKQDAGVVNEFFLANYSYDGSSYKFYFDYTINDLLIKLGSTLQNSLQMDYAIMVTVAKDRVSRYKRFAWYFENEDTQDLYVTVSYNDIIAKLGQYGVTDSSYNDIKAMDLFYNVEAMRYPYLAARVKYAESYLMWSVKD